MVYLAEPVSDHGEGVEFRGVVTKVPACQREILGYGKVRSHPDRISGREASHKMPSVTIIGKAQTK